MIGFAPTLCGLEYGRACPPSLSLRRGGRDVVPRASPYNSTGVTNMRREESAIKTADKPGEGRR